MTNDIDLRRNSVQFHLRFADTYKAAADRALTQQDRAELLDAEMQARDQAASIQGEIDGMLGMMIPEFPQVMQGEMR